MMKSIKGMVLTGAAVMVMMSFAAPAMADIDPNAGYTDYGVSSPVDPSVFDSPEPDVVGPAPTQLYPCYWYWTSDGWVADYGDGTCSIYADPSSFYDD